MGWMPIFAGSLAFGVTNLLLVVSLYRPVGDLPGTGMAVLHPLFGFAVYVLLAVLLFDWTARKMGNAWQAALALGLAQFLLVNVDLVLRGERAVLTAAMSTIVMVVSWTALAAAWNMASKKTRS
ncbi:hypothetical protein [Aurantiacibacter zhengii]|uniref:Uncharacterized protein n=1 Tax=Aurantiacibacter zhengii TaxID=2307003 RepID=A0A418NPK0_9SPHN|nr:hypothetical protein [Aurantiacibacter zhengii]RIV83906.1 hypothetical protein D2V07_15620 [Aurantiacibacter zhengii]